MYTEYVEKVVKAIVCGDSNLSKRDYEATVVFISDNLGCDLRESLTDEFKEADIYGDLEEVFKLKIEHIEKNSGQDKTYPLWKHQKGGDMSFFN